MAIHGDRQLNWLGRLLRADSVQQSYQEYQPGPVVPTLDVIGTGPVRILVHDSTSATDRTLEWTTLQSGEIVERLPEGFYYRFYFFQLATAATSNHWRALLALQGLTQISFEFIRSGGTPNGKTTFLASNTIGDNQTPAPGLQELARHWFPGPLEVELESVDGVVGNSTCRAWVAQMPFGAICPP